MDGFRIIPTIKKDDFLSTCIHESAHFCKNWFDGSILRSVEVLPDGEGTTITNHPIMKCLHKISWRHSVVKSFVSGILVGIASERYAKGKLADNNLNEYHKFHADIDLHLAKNFMKSCGWKKPSIDYDDNEFYRDFSQDAKLFSIIWRKEIKLFADELLKRRFISGYDAVRFLEKIWPKPLPEKAQPCHKHFKKGEK